MDEIARMKEKIKQKFKDLFNKSRKLPKEEIDISAFVMAFPKKKKVNNKIFEMGTRTYEKGAWVEYTEQGAIIHVLKDINKIEIPKYSYTSNIEEVMKTQLPNDCKIEALSVSKDCSLLPVKRSNAFLYAARTAFYNEYDFIINPDDIWLLISQGFGQYVNQNAEDLREKIVDFKGQMDITVVNMFQKGDKNNNWEGNSPNLGRK